jgi:uncharacterized protein YkwD
MKEFLLRVKRVSHVNRVSSNSEPNKFLAVFIVAAVSSFTFAFSMNPASAADITSQKVIELANSDRNKEGLGVLSENEKLDRSAMDKAEDMAKNNYFAHTSPEGLTPWHWIEKESYDYAYAGENLAMDFVSVEKMNQAWLASPTHRANILNEKYKDIGVAVKEGTINNHSTIIVVQQFGSGDKNEKEKAENISSVSLAKNKTAYPALPLAAVEADSSKTSSFVPLINIPKKNEVISSEEVEVIGRSAPGSKVTIWDGEKKVGQVFSDGKGWFRNEVAMLSEGNHELRAESEGYSGGANKIEGSLNKVSFSIDRSKPEVNYRIYSRRGMLGNEEYFLRVTTNEPNCTFKVGGQMRNITNSRSAYFSVSKNKLSSVIKIEDQAGNESTKHIILANYFQGSEQENLMGRAAQIFTNNNIFASESGRGTMKENLGLAMENNNNY